MPPRAEDPGAEDPAAKPLDIGTGAVAASIGRTTTALLSLLTVHGRHGTVELSALPPFDESVRADPAATRRYRSLMAGEAFACCRLETVDGEQVSAEPIIPGDPYMPAWIGRIGDAEVSARAVAEGEAIVLRWELTGPAPSSGLQLRFAGRLDRPALAEVTEISPPQPTGAVTRLAADGRRLTVSAPALPATAVLESDAGMWAVEGEGARLPIPWPADTASRAVSLRCTLVAGRARSAPVRPRQAGPAPRSRMPGVGAPLAPLIERALAYVRGCTALRAGRAERVILTDHRLLPLSWTRDAYYQALLLLATGERADQRRVAAHLRWLWRRCERPDGRWVRSHHANGRRKDIAFQADQQLYPVLELADFWRAVGQLPSGVDWTAAVDAAYQAALAEVDSQMGLMASTENAADDPAAAPFIAGSQILLWYAAQRLAELCRGGVLDLDGGSFSAVADSTFAAFGRAFVDDGRWAYATDGAAARVVYHDANDLPVALAPLWGFCPADDPGWRRTMEFAFSAANPGYFDGDRAGLGSAHTPGPWTLGDVQAWLVARQAGDPAAANRALERLAEVAFEDGMLPEAYSVTRDPDLRIRYWFAWPGAALAAFLILDADGLLETRLRAI